VQKHFLGSCHSIRVFVLCLLVLAIFAGAFIINRFVSAQYDYQKIGIVDASEGGYYSSRRLIVWGVHQEPSIKISTFDKVKRDVKVDIYKISKDELLDFLTYKIQGDNRYLVNTPDISKFNKVATIDAKDDEDETTLLPIDGQGLWLLRAYSANVESFSAIIRTAIGTVAKEGDNEIILWTQNIFSGKKIGNGSVEVFNLKDKPTLLSESLMDTNGIAKTSQLDNADVGFVDTPEGQTLVILNLPRDYYNYKTFSESQINTKYLLFTDRPLYAPGDRVYFKAIIRNDDDAEYSVPTGLATVKVYKDYDSSSAVFEKKYQISSNGTISGEYLLENTARPGIYQMSVVIDVEPDREWYLQAIADFNVEHYRKPEYNLEANVVRDELLEGETVTFHLSGKYFFGQPISGGKVKYSIQHSKEQYYTEENLEDYKKYGYGWYYYGGNEIQSGDIELDDKGEAEISVDTSSIPKSSFSIISLEATYQDESGNPVRTSKNILVRGNEYSIRTGNYEHLARSGQQISIPLTLLAHSDVSVSNVDISISPVREEWLRNEKAPLDTQGYYNYYLDKEILPNFFITTNSKGEAVLTYTPQKTGSYNFTLKVPDRRGNVYERNLYLWVNQENVPYYYQNSYGVTLRVQDREFAPGEIIPVSLSLASLDRDVLITVERDKVRRYFVTSVPGYATTIYIPAFSSDLPNVFVTASTFATKGYLFNSSSEKISFRKDSKEIKVSITPGAERYAPGETVELKIKTSDSSNLPLSSEVAVWAVDKSLYELMSEQRPSIVNTFWSDRYNSTNQRNSFQGIVSAGAEKGCFVGDTKVLTPDGLKKIEDIKPGDLILTRKNETDPTLVKATVKNVHSIIAPGYLILNGDIKVTAEHRMWVNNGWKDAGSIQIGDFLLNKDNNQVTVDSIEWQTDKTLVYNLTVKDKATYFAGNVYVHNDKGGDGRTRDNFADVAYWNPHVQTDANGNATVRFVLPDNLTTWLVQSIAVTYDTKVGENTADLLVTKPVIIRPILPNILRVGDDITISTLSHNFSGIEKQLEHRLTFDSGDLVDNQPVSFVIGNNSFIETLWNLKPLKSGIATIRAALSSTGNAKEEDSVSIKIPVKEFGFNERTSSVGEGGITFGITKFPDTDASLSKANLYLSASLFGTLPPAIDYLLQYPYGCVEQTTSRFVPAVIIKENEMIFKEITGSKDLPDLIKTGVDRLSILRDDDGGWGWWYGEVNPFITAYATEYLKRAERLGVAVPADLYKSTKTRFENELPKITDPTVRIGYIYTLSLLGSPLGNEEIRNFGTSTPDIIALGLLSNVQNGFMDRNTNGYNLLQSIAQEENGKKYWESGTWMFFGSREASTALALRALLKAGAPEEAIVGAARYLVSERKAEYWNNTFATAQTIDTLLEFTKKYNKSDVSTPYKVWLGENQVDSGVLQGVFDTRIVSIDPKLLVQDTKLRIESPEDNHIYSTFVFDQFRTDKNASPQSSGLSVTRTYKSSFGIGDIVDIDIQVSGIPQESRYLVIEDELPGGLVPVNKSFENERASSRSDIHSYYYWGGDKEYTENGIVASFANVNSDSVRLTYQARVVSRGVFNTPPARASLMYEPEVRGRTGASVITITGDKTRSVYNQGDEINIIEQVKTNDTKYSYVLGVLVVVAIIYGYVQYRKRKSIQPPTQDTI